MKKQDSCNRTAGENPGTIILYMICIFAAFASLTETNWPTTGENRAVEAQIERRCPCAPDGTREDLAQTARKCKFERREIHYTAHNTRSFVRKPSFPMFPRPVGSPKVRGTAHACKALCVPLQCTRNACAGGVFDRHPTAISRTFPLVRPLSIATSLHNRQKKRQRIVHLSKRPALPLTIFAQRAILLSASNQTPTRYGADTYPQQQKVVHRFIHRLQTWEGDPFLHDSSDHQTRRPSVGL